jgi:diguanylate cyclase
MTDEPVQKKIDLLQKVELFSTLAPEELEIVAYHSQMVRCRQGSLIFMEDSPGNELYVIKEGEVLITRRHGGDDVDIAQFIAGESFGEWDLFGNTSRIATAVAKKDSVLLVYPREGMTFHMFLQKYPKMSARMIYKLLAIITTRIRTTHRLINEKTPWVRNLKKQMLLDKLTGLYNKNFLMEECDGLLSRGDSPCALLIIKPDNFKEINDGFGHEAGDKILILMSIFIMSALREADIAVRYGGDEFAVVLPDTGREEAIAVARDLGVVLHGIDLERITGVSSVKISVSIGITMCPFHGSDALTLAEGAREKMHRARAMGGNRIIAKN